MTEIYQTHNKCRKVSAKQNKALLLPIPATIRDILELKHGTPIKWEVCINKNGTKYVKISKKTD